MAINIKFDLVGNPEPPTIILANRSGNKLGQLDVNIESIDLSDKLNDASEFSFTLNKYVDGKLTNLWDKVLDFKLVYCKEWDMWFEINVELDEATETVKTVFCTQLGQAELSQIMLYNIEINTDIDIEREDYKTSILYDEENPKASILHRMLEKAPHYSIAHVDDTIKGIQKSFSFDGSSICDSLSEVEEEVGCLVVYDSNSDVNGMPNRTISVYDLQQNCNNEDCKYRGEFTERCPKCGSTDINYGYGEDTLIFVTADELATEGIQLVTDTDSVKNCFKLEAGDDLMTATIRNCNPNGSDYIWYFSDAVKEDMSKELVEAIESYDAKYKEYYNTHISNFDENLVQKYNALVGKYDDYYNTKSTCLNSDCEHEGYFEDECPLCHSKNILTGRSLQTIDNSITGYSALMNAYYNTVDLALYLESGLMPSVEMSETTAEEQLKLLAASSLSPAAVNVENIANVSLATANSAVLSIAKVIVKPTYKVEIKASTIVDVLSEDKVVAKTWSGQFVVTNYSDETDTATNVEDETIAVTINNNTEEFIKQKIEKALNKENTDDYSISGLFEKDYDDFCVELKKYALNPLRSFYDACDTCISILIEQGAGNKDEKPDLYENLYEPYYNKSLAIAKEIKIREDEIAVIEGVYDETDENNRVLIAEGLQTNIEEIQSQIQNELDFESYLVKEGEEVGKNLWLEFCSYRREDKYTNDNYISDGLNNAELFERALEFIEVAENEIFKSAELQHSISATLNNLLAIPKFKPLVEFFNVGNWIRVRVDDRVYKLRLIKYDIGYGDFNNISVEFSDVKKIRNGITDVEGILSQASSMATSYSYVQRQANQGNDAKVVIEQWASDGLSSESIQIQNDENKNVTFAKNGLLCRSYDDITETYSPEQLKITYNIMAYTDDDWKTVKQAIGKHDYKFFDANLNEFTDKTGYGMSADFVTAGVVSGSQIIGGDIYSVNYPKTIDKETGKETTTGSYINLTDGTFSFAGGRLVYNGNDLIVDGKITVATEGTIGCWNVNKDTIYKGSEVFGDVNGMYFGTNGLSLGDAFKVTPSGEIFSNSGIIGGFTIDDTKMYTSTKSSLNSTDKNGVYIGTDGISVGGILMSDGGLQTFYAGVTLDASTGKLTANNAEISGKITANSGKIAKFEIENDGLSYIVGSIEDGSQRVFSITPDNMMIIGAANNQLCSMTLSHDGTLQAKKEPLLLNDGDSTSVIIDGDGISLKYISDNEFECRIGELGTYYNEDGAISHVIFGIGETDYIILDANSQLQLNAINSVYMNSGKITLTAENNGYLYGTWHNSSGNIITSWRGAKHDIEQLDNRYSVLFDELSPVRFKYNDGTSDRYHTGFILDELQTAMDTANIDSSEFAAYCVSDNETGAGGIRYEEIVSLNTWQIQNVKSRATILEDSMKKLEERIAQLENK